MLSYFPNFFSSKAIITYIIALLVIGVVFMNQAMYWYWWVFGISFVVLFFYGSNQLSVSWANLSDKTFEKKIFKTAFLIRCVVVIFLYFFFDAMTGQPFMFAAADAVGYHEEGLWVAKCINESNLEPYINYIDAKNGISDVGYPVWLGIQYSITGGSVIVARLLKSLLSAFMCVLVYRLTKRNFGDKTGRMAAIFCMLMPNLILYCGMHLKETEMVFLTIYFAERADYLIRSKHFSIKNIIVVLLLLGSLFCFRTVLGVAAIFAFCVALVLSSSRIMSKARRWGLLLVAVLAIVTFMGGKLAMEIEEYWANKDTNQEVRLVDRAKKGNEFAKYAGAAVFAPMIFTFPFPTMVETPNQETFRMLHGGLVVKNIMSFFCIFAIGYLLFKKQWRNHVFLGAFVITYLGILMLSAFAHSERFHLPAVPFELIFAALGVSLMTKKEMKWYNYWLVFMFIVFMGWTWFKLKGRGFI